MIAGVKFEANNGNDGETLQVGFQFGTTTRNQENYVSYNVCLSLAAWISRLCVRNRAGISSYREHH
jgi:hypothetical protein